MNSALLKNFSNLLGFSIGDVDLHLDFQTPARRSTPAVASQWINVCVVTA
jgi:hypothetical protein